ncbi:hypothetical protein F4561_002684 [Lipingzhangella halophila]|uniref:SWIM-type domain-containing protein n=1 Tax=Lipingzhangella halophila TaxID=1783352 RepID=A0A7W7RH46_9ACTN|nr:DUF6011 domain-containing protein [Lipingzhangella halophila]MBB4931864.1 hypothetical protein [Lipingzhangella halophila]
MSARAERVTRCLRCGRVLRSTRSLNAGYGPTCRAKVRAAAKAAVLAQYKAHQVEKAQELIDQGALIPLRGHRVFLAVSTDGSVTYRAHRAACTCPAGIKGRHACKHQIAAHILGLAA